jgi:hypothetical protein
METEALLPGNHPVVTSVSLSRATACGATNTLVVKGHTSVFLLSNRKFRVLYKTREFLAFGAYLS